MVTKPQRLLGQYGTNPYLRALMGTGKLVASAAPYAYRAGKALRTLTKKKGVREGDFTSFQHDRALRYRYKPMPRKRRRRWVKKVKANLHMDLQQQPLQSYTLYNVGQVTSAINQQGYVGWLLHSSKTVSETDYQSMFTDAYGSLANNERLYVKSACLDIQLVNTGSNVVAGTYNQAPVILDIYRLAARKTVWNATDKLDTMFTTCFQDQTYITAGNPSSPPVTVFQNPSFCKYWKVLDKREVILGTGTCTTLQLRDSKDRMIESRFVNTCPQALPRITQAYLIMFRGTPNANVTANGLSAVQLNWSIQKTYEYAIPPGATAERIHDA